MKKPLLTLSAILIILITQAQEFSFEYGGLLRTYLIHLPPDYNEDNDYPLVINMHGLGSNANEQQFYSQFDQVADTAGIVMVYPNGVNNVWNITFDSGVDDVGFISALIDTISTNYSIDLDRVYSTGMSMGGFMSHRLACQLDNRIAAIGSVTGTLAYPNCFPQRAFPVLQIHGTADSTVPYALVPPTMAHWIIQNECLDTTTIDLPDIDTTDQSTVTKSIYSPCDSEVEVILYTVIGGEHTWPGAPIEIGITNYDINASVEIWNFFRQYTLPDFLGNTEFLANQDKLFIFPQPATTMANIKLPFEKMRPLDIKLYDFSGHLLRNKSEVYSNSITIKRNGLKSGIYIVEVTTRDAIYREKIVFK